MNYYDNNKESSYLKQWGIKKPLCLGNVTKVVCEWF